jgi:hypothetical protein
MDRLEGYYDVKSFGAHGDGRTDDTASLQRAVDKASERGGVVYMPPGQYRVSGSIVVKHGVTITGVHEAPVGYDKLTGTVILATGGRGEDNDNAPALFEVRDSAAVQNLSVYYPEQEVDDIQPYPWTFHLYESDNTVECVTLINSYKGIRVGPEGNSRHRIRSVYGCVLRCGIWVDNCWEIGRVENCQFHTHWWSKPALGGDWAKIVKYMAENLEAFVFGRTDWEYITNNFVFAARIGYRFIHTPNGECNGHMTGCGADGTQTAVQVDRLQRMGLLVTGGEFVSLAGLSPCQVRISDTFDQGTVRFVNTAFWGLSDHVAHVQGNGYLSFTDCYFTNWKEDVDKKPLIVVKSGRLQVSSSTFDTHHPAIELGPEVVHAIVRGNNGVNGVRVIDNTGGRAIVADNEEAVAPAAVQPFGISGRPRPGGGD